MSVAQQMETGYTGSRAGRVQVRVARWAVDRLVVRSRASLRVDGQALRRFIEQGVKVESFLGLSTLH